MRYRLSQLGLGACAFLSLCFAPVAARADHVPPPNTPVNYAGDLIPGVPVMGQIGFSNPVDGYDWFRILVDSGVSISLTSTRLSGDLVPNIVLYQGFANEGAPVSTLAFLVNTNNGNSATTALNYTPNFTGAVTVAQSTFLGQNGGTYQLSGTGFRSPRRKAWRKSLVFRHTVQEAKVVRRARNVTSNPKLGLAYDFVRSEA